MFSGATEGENTLRRKRWISIGFVPLAVAAAIAAAFVSGSKAASPSICTKNSTDKTDASCVKETVLPHVLTAGQDAVSITKFTNQSGVGGATATHVTVSVSFSAPVAVKRITLFVNGTQVFSNPPPDPPTSSPCTPASLPASSATTVSCSAGEIAGGGTAKLIVRFSTSSAVTLIGAATYGESGKDNPSGPKGVVNDKQVARDSLSMAGGATAEGKCVDLGSTDFAIVSGSSDNGTTLQTTTATFGRADPSQNLPCTPAAGGVINATPSPLKTQISFVELAEFPGFGYATVNVDITPLPTNLSKFVLIEDTQFVPPFFATYITVPKSCDANTGLPPNAGPLEQGATDSTPHHNDTCIASTSTLPRGGARFVLHVIGSPFDGHYGG